MYTENPHEVLLVVLIVTLCFGFEAACSRNKDDINLMDFLFFVLGELVHTANLENISSKTNIRKTKRLFHTKDNLDKTVT